MKYEPPSGILYSVPIASKFNPLGVCVFQIIVPEELVIVNAKPASDSALLIDHDKVFVPVVAV